MMESERVDDVVLCIRLFRCSSVHVSDALMNDEVSACFSPADKVSGINSSAVHYGRHFGEQISLRPILSLLFKIH